MRQFINFIAVFATLMLIPYAAAAFISLERNPLEWHVSARIVYAMWGVFCLIASAEGCNEE